MDVHSDCSQSTKNTKSLSGGERSYATVCFIMSLWEAMEAPFRCLDEFDVFMVSLPFYDVVLLMENCDIIGHVISEREVRSCSPGWKSGTYHRVGRLYM